MIGVRAMIGTRGRSRDTLSAVEPECEKQQIALMFVVSEISRAAATIASAVDDSLAERLASMI